MSKENDPLYNEKDPFKRYLLKGKITPEFSFNNNWERKGVDKLLAVINSHYSKYCFIYDRLDTIQRINLRNNEIKKVLNNKIYNEKQIDNKLFTEGYISACSEHLNNYIDKLKRYNGKNVKKKDLAPQSLKDLFSKESDFDIIIEKLIFEKFAYITNNEVRINKPKYPLNLKRFICCIGHTLERKKYLKPLDSDAVLAQALTFTFNIDISPNNYSQAKKAFSKTNGNDSAAEYINDLKFL